MSRPWRPPFRLLIGAAVAFAVLYAAPPLLAQQVPSVPDPVAVSVDPATTAVVVLDITQQTCASQPACLNGLVPNIASFLGRAREAGAYVVYSTPPSGGPVLPEVTPEPGDPVILGQGQDRFYNTDLDSQLQARGIRTIVLMGWREDGSVMYTSVGATLRGYTVVVADDGTSAARDYDVAIGRYMMLTQLNANPTNEPPRPKAVTLSRTDLITFQ
jgi:nicotinamidase-related amidase